MGLHRELDENNTKRITDALLTGAKDPDEDVRKKVLSAASLTPEAFRLWCIAVQDPSVRIRRRAAGYLCLFWDMKGKSPSERAEVVAALQRLIKDSDWGVRRDVIKFLKYADDWAIPILELAKDDPDPRLRREAAEALRQVRARALSGSGPARKARERH